HFRADRLPPAFVVENRVIVDNFHVDTGAVFPAVDPVLTKKPPVEYAFPAVVRMAIAGQRSAGIQGAQAFAAKGARPHALTSICNRWISSTRVLTNSRTASVSSVSSAIRSYFNS